MNPIAKDVHEGKIIEYIGKNLIYAKDRCVGRLNRSKNQSASLEAQLDSKNQPAPLEAELDSEH